MAREKYLMIDDEVLNEDLVESQHRYEILGVIKDLRRQHGYHVLFHSTKDIGYQYNLLKEINRSLKANDIIKPVLLFAVEEDYQNAGEICQKKSFETGYYNPPQAIIFPRHLDRHLDEPTGYSHKTFTRLALEEALNISESERENHIVFDDEIPIVYKALEEGYQAYLIGKDCSLLQALQIVWARAEDKKTQQCTSEDREPLEERQRRYEQLLSEQGLIVPKTDNEKKLLEAMSEYINNKEWESLKLLIEQSPMVLNFALFNQKGSKLSEFTPNLLYFIQSFADNSPEFKKLFLEIMQRSDWNQTDSWFKNTPFTYAVAVENTTSINILFDYLKENNPKMLTEANKYHQDAKNTPLLLAIKNGNKELALKLIPYYQKEDLMQLTRYGNSALHLASYMKLNSVIQAIMERAKVLDCVDDLTKQPNRNKFRPITLYRAEYLSKEPGESAEIFFEPVRTENHNVHNCFSCFGEEIGKHRFNYKKHGEGKKKEIKNLLKPTPVYISPNTMFDQTKEAKVSSGPQKNNAQENDDWSIWDYLCCFSLLQYLLDLFSCATIDVEESENKTTSRI